MKTCSKCGETKPLTSFHKKGPRLNSRCAPCHLASVAEYRRANPEIHRSSSKRWNRKNKEKVRVENARRYAANPAKARANAKAWKSANPERAKANSAAWHAKNIEKIRAYARAHSPIWDKKNPDTKRAHRAARRARIIGADGSHTDADIKALFTSQRGQCAICRVELGLKYDVDHVLPLKLCGGNGKGNLQLLCPPCNGSKGAKHPIDFMQERGFLL